MCRSHAWILVSGTPPSSHRLPASRQIVEVQVDRAQPRLTLPCQQGLPDLPRRRALADGPPDVRRPVAIRAQNGRLPRALDRRDAPARLVAENVKSFPRP